MRDVIKLLLDDHHKIEEAISKTKTLMALPPEKSFQEINTNLTFFKNFTFGEHHRRENEILYMWMTKQNPNSDTSVIDRIKNEHCQLEELAGKISKAINSHLKKTPDTSVVTILSDLHDFILLYKEHMEKEEKFIFMIAEGLKLSQKEKENMLKKMQQPLKGI